MVSLADNIYNQDRKSFALKNRSAECFSCVMQSLYLGEEVETLEIEKFAENKVKEYILKMCNSLGKAKEYIGNL